MTDTDAAVERFLRAYDDAMDEYEAGYADADATLGVVDGHVDRLREAVATVDEEE
ncbi:hypothetical protein ACFQE8_03070 [Salinirubellus sp. GCM10025818]|jgi:hypothetical protein|uniref:hypothetical protein n=1 Tax=Salinirubellus TaxID=2162630 RepID=UPI0030D075B8